MTKPIMIWVEGEVIFEATFALFLPLELKNMIKLVLLISVIVLFAGCVGLDKSVQEKQPALIPTLPVRPTSTAPPLMEENISKNRYLVF